MREREGEGGKPSNPFILPLRRAITKILGDWWANLEKKDQEPFKSLASDVSGWIVGWNLSFHSYPSVIIRATKFTTSFIFTGTRYRPEGV